jgi:hypothetical protein
MKESTKEDLEKALEEFDELTKLAIIKMFENKRIERIEKQIFKINFIGAVLALSILLHTAKDFLQ